MKMIAAKNNRILLTLLACLGFLALFAPAADAREIPIANLQKYERWDQEIVDLFAKLPVQDDGRIKPLETVARFRLYRINGKRTLTFGIKPDGQDKVEKIKLNAVEWYLDCVFRPDIAEQLPFVLVDNVDVISDIKIKPHKTDGGTAVLRSRYSYAEFRPAMPNPEDPSDKGLLTEKRETYLALQQSDPKAFEKDLKKQQLLQLHDNLAVLNYLLHMVDFARGGLAGNLAIGKIAPDLGDPEDPATPFSGWLEKFGAIPAAAMAAGYDPQQVDGLMRQLRAQLNGLANVAGGNTDNPVAGISIFAPTDPADEDWRSIGEEILRTVNLAEDFKLRLATVEAPEGLPDAGQSIVVVGLVAGDLHVRVFDAGGEMVFDKAEKDMVPGPVLDSLKQALGSLPEASELTAEQRRQIIDSAISVSGFSYPEGIERVKTFEALVASAGSQEQFKSILKPFVEERIAEAKARGEYSKVPLELKYYKMHFIANAMPWFIFGFLFVALSWLTPGSAVGRFLGWASVGTCVLATCYVVGALVTRCLIMGRPPISTLYETILFIAAAAVILCLVLEYFDRRKVALAAAAVLGAAGMFLALRYEIKEAVDGKGDTMVTLPAVLRSNFWLGTHVIIINLGYASALLASGLSLIYIASRFFHLGKPDTDIERGVTRMVYGIVCFTLLFSLVGTVLGGVWANDSWGRFWGWDPKENGALMIVLWSLVMLHARMGGYIKRIGLHATSVVLGLITVFSWWGVNLLDIGLHSYGRTTGVAEILNVVYWTGGVFVFAAGILWIIERALQNARLEEAAKSRPVRGGGKIRPEIAP